MPNTPTKPIAILACKYSQGMDWAREILKDQIWEINGAHHRITADDGQVYIICTQMRDIRGYEFKDIRIAYGFGDHPNYDEFLAEAKTRMR